MSSPPLRVFLKSQEDQTLFELRKAVNVPQIAKDRAQVIRLSSQGWKVSKIASYFGWSVQTVRSTIHRWKNRGLVGLWDAPRPGRTRKWKPEDLEKLEESLEKEQRTYSSRQLAQKLLQEREVSLSTRHLRRILKKRASFGNVLASLTKTSKTQNQEQLVKLT
jgi:transposase